MSKVKKIYKKRLLLNWVYYRPVGHVVEALKLAKGYALANKNIDVYLAMNAASPVELAGECAWIKKTYPVSLTEVWKKGKEAPSIQKLPKTWDYIITDSRVQHLKKGWDEDDLMKTQKVLTGVLRGTSKGFTEQTGKHDTLLPCTVNPKINLPIPDSAKKFAKRYKHEGPAICIMLGGSAGSIQSPSMAMWHKICQALFAAIPDLTIYFTGVTTSLKGRTTTEDFKLSEVQQLAKSLPTAKVAYDIGLWNQLALIQKCDVFLSPHTGFAFLLTLVGTPWLELANCRWPAYIFNDIPFYSVLPDCGWYPAQGETKKGCGKLLSDHKKALCVTDKLLEKKIPEIVEGAKLLLDKNYTYHESVVLHLKKIRKHYNLSKFFFFGGVENFTRATSST